MEELFTQAHLPLSVLDDRDTRVPLMSLINLMERSANRLDLPVLGLEIGRQMAPDSFGHWARYAASADNLSQALDRAVETLWTHQSGARMSVFFKDEYGLFYYHNPLPSELRGSQHSDHCIWPMISLVRIFLGRDWMPEWIEIDYPKGRSGGPIRDYLDVDCRFGCDGVGIAIPRSRLSSVRTFPIISSKIVSLNEVLAAASRNGSNCNLAAISNLISLRLMESGNTLDCVAAQLQLSTRTLQRILADEGTNYRELLEKTRMRRAAELLKEGSSTITEIAQSVGYSDLANFTRAFRRHYERTPSQYQRIAKPARNVPMN